MYIPVLTMCPTLAGDHYVLTSNTCFTIASAVPNKSVEPVGLRTCSSIPLAPGATVFLRKPKAKECQSIHSSILLSIFPFIYPFNLTHPIYEWFDQEKQMLLDLPLDGTEHTLHNDCDQLGHYNRSRL